MSRLLVALCVLVAVAALAVSAAHHHEDVGHPDHHDHNFDRKHYHEVLSAGAKAYPAHAADHTYLKHLAHDSPGAHQCVAHGEIRRQHSCLSIKHTKKDVCCWQNAAGQSGLLPYSCCGVHFAEHKCASIVEHICEHHDGAF
jgi:hypothetical protein